MGFRMKYILPSLHDIDRKEYDRGYGHIYQHPFQRKRIIVCPPHLIYRRGYGSCPSGCISRYHHGCAVFTERPGKGKYYPRYDPCLAAGQDYPEKNIETAESQCLSGLFIGSVKGFEGAPACPVHERKDYD